ncbi:hypothetical protein [Dethiothermospora halolimnae]|uniref:ParM/StbA family protein n=1 Tax=Dethiothermospora halolimnae TaxID=3114390 RepID=UPI003CCB90A6
MIIGVDNGYTYTKNSKGIIFPSKVREGEDLDINNVIRVEYQGRNYIVGEKESNYTVDTNKANDEKTLLNIITSIGMSVSNKSNIKVMTGLPPLHYKAQKETLKSNLIDRNFNIKINGDNKSFRISDADVFIQGAGPVFQNPTKYINSKTIVIDIGGLTVDVCYFEGLKLLKYRTYTLGMLKLYSNVISQINEKLELDLIVADAEKILNEGIKIYGEQQDITFLKPILDSHINNILTNIKLDFPLKTMDHIIQIGGGSICLNLDIPNAEILPNSQFINAYCYEEIGKVRFDG